MASSEDLVQLEDLDQVSIPVKQEPQECVVCITQSVQTFEIYTTHTTASKTSLHDYLQRLTDSELPYSPEFAKYICKTCLDLVNDLETAEIEYNKLRDTFKNIISKNPLFSLTPPQIQTKLVNNEPRCSQPVVPIKKEVKDDGLSQPQPTCRRARMPQCAFKNCVSNHRNSKVSEGVSFCRGPSNKFNTIVKLEPIEEEDASLKEYEIQYTPTKWGTVLVSRKGDELITERPGMKHDVTVERLGEDGHPLKRTRKKPVKKEVEIPAKIVILENGEKVFECKICQRQFKQKGNYNRHASTHTGDMPYECTTCNRRFNRKDHLLNHIRTHTGEKPFECNFCLLKFNQKGSIIKHLRTHTGQEPFQCNVCQKRFKQRPHLNSHIRIHTGEKPYECKVCKRRFIESSKLKIHVRTHTGERPYKCTYCDRQFNQTGNLQSHLRTHTGEKPFECTVCHRRFNLRHHLRDHTSVHTGEKPFHCTVCKQRFNYKHVLQNHLRVMHPPEVMHELYPDSPEREANVDSEASGNSDRNFDDGNSERNFDDGNSERNFDDRNSERTSEVGVNSASDSMEESGNEKTIEVTVEPSIEVSVKAEPIDYNYSAD